MISSKYSEINFLCKNMDKTNRTFYEQKLNKITFKTVFKFLRKHPRGINRFEDA